MFSSTDSTAANPLYPQLPVASTTFHGGSHQIPLPQIQDHYLFPHMLVSANNNNVNKHCCRPRTGIKKDRHTKILTAQGPRDRRVRLSICIARKFFDLQDALGFDKPSKTLNWLFSKSKLAIEELTPPTTSTTDAKMVVKEDAGDSHEMGARPKDSPMEKEDTIGVTDLAKHSRAKARARARARTIKKMCIKELSEAKMLLAATQPSPLTQTCKKPPLHNNELTKESITPRFCSVWDIPQHLMMPKHLGLGDNNGYSHNASSTIMCGVNSSQVLQICTKSWGCSDHNYQN